MYSTGNNNKRNEDDHEDVEYLSRKALQRYMDGNTLQQNEDGETHNEINNDISNNLENNKENQEKDNVNSKTVTDKNNKKDEQGTKTNKNSTDQDFEHMLRLDNANDSKVDDIDGNIEREEEEDDDDEGEDKLLSKLVDETNDKGEENDDEGGDDDDDNEDHNDALDSSAGNGLLESLTTDIEKYHKKVQLKKKFDHSTLAMEKKIAKDLNKSQENSENPKKRNLELETQTDDANINNDNTNQSKDLNTNSTNNEPSNKKAKTTSKKISSWTKAEDDAIVYYKEEMKYSWKKIEELLEQQHSWQAIQMRYLRNHKSRNDEWSRFMEIRLINLIRKDWENRWKRISAELGKDFGPERCITKNIEICKKMELPYFSNVFTNKDITSGYKNQFNDIKDAEAHKKLMLVYMGLDSITYEDSDNEDKIDSNKILNPTDSAKLITTSIKDSKSTNQSTDESTTEAVAAAAAAVATTDPEEEIIHDNDTTNDKPTEPSDINKIIGMNMTMRTIEGDEDNNEDNNNEQSNNEDSNENNNQGEDITSNVDPAIAGEGISK